MTSSVTDNPPARRVLLPRSPSRYSNRIHGVGPRRTSRPAPPLDPRQDRDRDAVFALLFEGDKVKDPLKLTTWAVRAAGSIAAGAVLSQVMYWSGNDEKDRKRVDRRRVIAKRPTQARAKFLTEGGLPNWVQNSREHSETLGIPKRTCRDIVGTLIARGLVAKAKRKGGSDGLIPDLDGIRTAYQRVLSKLPAKNRIELPEDDKGLWYGSRTAQALFDGSDEVSPLAVVVHRQLIGVCGGIRLGTALSAIVNRLKNLKQPRMPLSPALFAQLLGVSKNTARAMINELEGQGFIWGWGDWHRYKGTNRETTHITVNWQQLLARLNSRAAAQPQEEAPDAD